MDELVTASNALGSANVLVKVASTDRLQPAMQALAPARHVTTLTLNTSALVNNLRALKAHAGAEGVIAVIKGLGYGTDPVLLGRLLEAQNVDWLAVAYADEGVVLREAGIRARILVLNPDPSTFGTMHAHDLEPQLVSTMHVQLAKEWAEANEVDGWPVHLKLDTGMHRLGLGPNEDEFVETLLQSPAIGTRQRDDPLGWSRRSGTGRRHSPTIERLPPPHDRTVSQRPQAHPELRGRRAHP